MLFSVNSRKDCREGKITEFYFLFGNRLAVAVFCLISFRELSRRFNHVSRFGSVTRMTSAGHRYFDITVHRAFEAEERFFFERGERGKADTEIKSRKFCS